MLKGHEKRRCGFQSREYPLQRQNNIVLPRTTHVRQARVWHASVAPMARNTQHCTKYQTKESNPRSSLGGPIPPFLWGDVTHNTHSYAPRHKQPAFFGLRCYDTPISVNILRAYSFGVQFHIGDGEVAQHLGGVPIVKTTNSSRAAMHRCTSRL